jgi:hypothetical protein
LTTFVLASSISSQQSSKHTKPSILYILGFGALSLLFLSGIHYFGNCRIVGKGRRTLASASLIGIGFQSHAYLLKRIIFLSRNRDLLLSSERHCWDYTKCFQPECIVVTGVGIGYEQRFDFCVEQNLKAQKKEGHKDRERVLYLYMLVEWKEQRTKTGKVLDLQGFKRDLSWSWGQESAISLAHQDVCSWHFSADSKGDHSQHRELAYIANK